MRIFIAGVCFAVTLAGCAEYELRGAIDRTNTAATTGSAPIPGLYDYSALADGRVHVDNATQLALMLADAYADAGRSTQQLQDIATGGFILAAAWSALGAAEGVADEVLTERAIGAIAVERFTRRGVPRSAVSAMYLGAQRMNCVATVPNLYERRLISAPLRTSTQVDADVAGFLMMAAMREIEYRTFSSLASRDLEGFSSLTSAFEGAASIFTDPQPDEEATGDVQIEGGVEQTPELGTRVLTVPSGAPQVVALERNEELIRFYRALAGCLGASDPTPATNSLIGTLTGG